MEELRVDMRERSPELQEFYNRQEQLTFKLNHTMPRTEEYFEVLKELFGDRLGEGSYIRTPISGAALENLVVGKNCYINGNFLAMARGGITIDDTVQIKRTDIETDELKLVARALLPADIEEGTNLKYELMQYTIVE